MFIDLSELKPVLGNAVVNFSAFISGGASDGLLCLKDAVLGVLKPVSLEAASLSSEIF